MSRIPFITRMKKAQAKADKIGRLDYDTVKKKVLEQIDREFEDYREIYEKANGLAFFYRFRVVDEDNNLIHVDVRRTFKYKNWREEVFRRDNYTCQKCGKTGKLNAHHIQSYSEYPEEGLKVDNGITLCLDCHSKEHGGVLEKLILHQRRAK